MPYMFCDPVYILPMCEVKRPCLNLGSTNPPDCHCVGFRVSLHHYRVDERGTSVFMEHVKNHIEQVGGVRGGCVSECCVHFTSHWWINTHNDRSFIYSWCIIHHPDRAKPSVAAKRFFFLSSWWIAAASSKKWRLVLLHLLRFLWFPHY